MRAVERVHQAVISADRGAAPRIQRCGTHACTSASGCRERAEPRGSTRVSDRGAARIPSIIGRVLADPGQALDPHAKILGEQGLGANFGMVRVHDNAEAAESARAVGARAYTVGHHIVFGAGGYAPRTSWGNRLIAHELVHVLQQTGGRNGRSSTDALQGLTIESSSSPAEHEASALAIRITSGERSNASTLSRGGAPVSLQREATFREMVTQAIRVDPFDAWSASSASDSATKDAESSGLPGRTNGPRDAFRHCDWNCVMTRSIGADEAKEVADTHEALVPNAANESTMDFHNNDRGRRCGLGKGDCRACRRSELSAGNLLIIPDYAGGSKAPPVPSGAVAPSPVVTPPPTTPPPTIRPPRTGYGS